MILNFTNGLIILFGLTISWLILYSLFSDKSPKSIGLKLGILVLFLSPVIENLSYKLYAMVSREWFFKSSNGEIQLAYTPMRTTFEKGREYCKQFTDQNGNSLDLTANDSAVYCGSFFGMYEKIPVFIPYKILSKNKAIYWASPELKIIGPVPVFAMKDAHG